MPTFIEPDTVRISVLGGDTQLDAGLPVSVPIAALMPDLLTTLGVASSDEPAPADDCPGRP